MKFQTQYTYETKWSPTKEDELLRIIKEELKDVEPEGVLSYLKDELKKKKVITVGNCRVRVEV